MAAVVVSSLVFVVVASQGLRHPHNHHRHLYTCRSTY
jgi:hypothetical protein